MIPAVFGATHIQFTLKTTDKALAEARISIADSHIEAFFKELRSGFNSLSHRQTIALSGEVYQLIIRRFQENPGLPEAWTAFEALNFAATNGRVLSVPRITDQPLWAFDGTMRRADDLPRDVNVLPIERKFEALENRFGWMADWVLTRNNLSIDRKSRIGLLQAVAEASTDAARQLKRNAQGDYSSDPKAQRFPPVQVTAAITLETLFEKWVGERSPSSSTLQSWRPTIAHLTRYLRHAIIGDITPEDIVGWKDKLLSEDRHPKTVNGTYLACLNTLMKYAVSNKLVSHNPAGGIRALAPKKAGTKRLPYTDAEVGQLLLISQKSATAQFKWLIWLAASTGARIGELAQLWAERVVREDGIYVLLIAPAPDGGSLKNEGSERKVPLHPDILSEGFLDFVAEKGDGPLFYGSNSGRAGSRHASKGVTNRVGTWIRNQGFNNARQSPNHAFRHWFKSSASRWGVVDSVADALQGHNPGDSAGAYRHFTLQQLAEAVARLPIKSLTLGSSKDFT